MYVLKIVQWYFLNFTLARKKKLLARTAPAFIPAHRKMTSF